METEFPIQIRELTDLVQVQLSQDELQEFLNNHGRIDGLMKKLKTNSQTGLSDSNKQDLSDRAHQFGRNEIPPRPAKSFLRLMFETVQDTTLIILIVSAVISLLLYFFFHDASGKYDGDEYAQISML